MYLRKLSFLLAMLSSSVTITIYYLKSSSWRHNTKSKTILSVHYNWTPNIIKVYNGPTTEGASAWTTAATPISVAEDDIAEIQSYYVTKSNFSNKTKKISKQTFRISSPYVPPASKTYSQAPFCARYGSRDAGWPRNWPHQFSSIPTSLRNKSTSIHSALKRQLSKEKLSRNDKELLAKYRGCSTRQNLSESDAKPACDNECERFRQVLNDWPANQPKAVIYFVVARYRLSHLQESLRRLDLFFNNQYHYPVILFMDWKNEQSNATWNQVRSTTQSCVFIQYLTPQTPQFIRMEEVAKSMCGSSIEYRHMCRFQARKIYEHPILENVDYVWRLDTDSKLRRAIPYDVFQFMVSHSIVYGYIVINLDKCVDFLWETSCKYVSEEYIRTQFFHKWKNHRQFYNNFEISALSLWRSCEYRNYIDYIDRLGGIYYFRWGDAPIRSIAVSMIVPLTQIHQFKDIKYKHQNVIK